MPASGFATEEEVQEVGPKTSNDRDTCEKSQLRKIMGSLPGIYTWVRCPPPHLTADGTLAGFLAIPEVRI